MSTVNAMADAQTGREVVPTEVLPSQRSEIRFTATQIEQNCPPQLQDLAKRLTEGLEKLHEQKALVADQEIAVKKLIADVKALCDDGGFKAFREKFFPELGKSRVYELLAIGTHKKSVQEIRAAGRARVAKHRANKAVDTQFRYSNGNSEWDAQLARKEPEEVEAPSTSVEQTRGPTKPRSLVTSGDEALRGFTVRVLELNRTTEKRPPERFSKAPVPVEILERLGNLLINIAKHKKFGDLDEETPAAAPRSTASDKQPAEDSPAERPVQAAEDLRP